jgi:hypothetical protein
LARDLEDKRHRLIARTRLGAPSTPRLLKLTMPSQLIGHDVSKARNQTRVQPVGLGDEAFGVAKRLDPPRIDREDRDARLDQRRRQLPRIAADRLQRHPAHATLAQGGDNRCNTHLVVAHTDRLAEGMKPEVKPGRAKSSQVEPTSTPAETELSSMRLILSYTRARPEGGPCDCSEQTFASGT